MNTHVAGIKGEDLAVSYLKKHKIQVLQRNFSCLFGEIDIVAKDGKFIVFAEVKMRSSDEFGLPREAVNPQKQRTIVVCSKLWLSQNKLMGKPVRYDVIEVYNEQVVLLKDAFRPE